MNQTLVLVSRSPELISQFEDATRSNGWHFEFYDDHPDYNACDRVIWDIDSVFPTSGGEAGKLFALARIPIDKTTLFFVLHFGFVGIIVKPLAEQQFSQIFANVGGPLLAPTVLASNFSIMNDSYLDSYLKLPRGQRTLEKLFQVTIERFEEGIPDIKKHLQNKDFKSLASLTHRLKSTCGNAGFMRLHVLCHWLELASENNNAQICVDLIKNCLDDTYSEAIATWQSLNLG